MRTIAIINQKGGCGKTTTAINLAAVFARRGFRTLLVDMDPQSHCAAGLGVPEKCIERDVTDALLTPESRPIDADRLIWRVSRNLDLLPSRMRLAGLEAARGGLADAPDKEQRLRRAVARLDATTPPDGETIIGGRARRYDVCLIDCPPSIGLLTYNALVASREILIPVETSFFSLKGAGKQVNTVRSLARRLGLRIRPHLVATMHDASLPIAKDLLRELREQFGNAVVPAVVRADTKVKEAASLGRPVIDHAPGSTGAEDYTSLCEWLVEHADIDRLDLADPEPALPVEVAAPDAPAHAPAATEQRATAAVSRLEELARRARAMSGRGTAPAGVHAEPAGPVPAVAPSPAPMAAAAIPAPVPARAEPATATAAAIRRSMLARPVAIELVDEPVQPPVALLDSVRRLLGCRPTARGALFVQPLTLGRTVSIAGDFNAWRPEASVMRRNEALGVFELQIDMPPGAHRYRLVVDGRWQTDDHNPVRDRNDFGDENNVVRVPPGTA